MGKAKNIKRAKKLKETKRKREQDTLISAGLGPASKVMKERNAKNKIEIKLNDSKVKYSELLKAFAHPIVDKSDSISIIKTKYLMCIYAWNAAVLQERSEELYLLAKKDLSSIILNNPEIEQLFDEMVKLKQEEFSEFKNIIVDFEIKKITGLDYDLTVATTVFKD